MAINFTLPFSSLADIPSAPHPSMACHPYPTQGRHGASIDPLLALSADDWQKFMAQSTWPLGTTDTDPTNIIADDMLAMLTPTQLSNSDGAASSPALSSVTSMATMSPLQPSVDLSMAASAPLGSISATTLPSKTTNSTQATPPPLMANTSDDGESRTKRIKRPCNAFILFRSHAVTTNLIPKEVERDHRNISRIISHMWHSLDDSERKQWEEQAELEKQRHREMHPDYKYRPASRRQNVHRRNIRRLSSTERQCERIADAILKSCGREGVKQMRAPRTPRKKLPAPSTAPVASMPSSGLETPRRGSFEKSEMTPLSLTPPSHFSSPAGKNAELEAAGPLSECERRSAGLRRSSSAPLLGLPSALSVPPLNSFASTGLRPMAHDESLDWILRRSISSQGDMKLDSPTLAPMSLPPPLVPSLAMWSPHATVTASEEDDRTDRTLQQLESFSLSPHVAPQDTLSRNLASHLHADLSAALPVSPKTRLPTTTASPMSLLADMPFHLSLSSPHDAQTLHAVSWDQSEFGCNGILDPYSHGATTDFAAPYTSLTY